VAATPSVGTREAGTSEPIRRPPRRRIGLPHVLIAVAAILAFLFNFLALQSRDETVLVAMAGTSIAQGSPLSPDLIRLEPLPATFGGLDNLVTAAEVGGLTGAIVTRPISEGQLLDRSAFVEPGSNDGLRSMSIPVAVEHAAGGSVSTGDRVDVISVVDGEPKFVATDLEVLGVFDRDQGGRLAATSAFHVVVGVTPDQALDVAGAIDLGSIELVRSTGAEALEGP
jgi:Flp pilus assembly protein CpaB